ncbi:MAG TPA: class I SAM-dependent methyltransferase [Acidimicrobiales bacterium]|nr:class I SAM-dependent methyltransferase [Acidimicrobiales bacterium]
MAGLDPDVYQARFDELERRGVDIHGEARLVLGLGPRTVLDAGCGTGRVAVELARRGVDVLGVDVDPAMIAKARSLAPDLRWLVADLARMRLSMTFDVVLLAGNVPLFTHRDDRDDLVARCAEHVSPGGALVAGFQLGKGYDLDQWDRACSGAGLGLGERWATWDGEPFVPGGDYCVSLHRRPVAPRAAI